MSAPLLHPPGHAAAGVPFRQLDPGTFDVRSHLRSNGSSSVVGHIFVETINNNVKVEHYALAPAFASPNSTQDMRIERRAQSHTSLSAFLNEMRGLESPGNTFTYIRAECETFSSLPS